MKLAEIRTLAEQRGLSAKSLKKTPLIRALQKSEGFQPCYATEHSASCGQESCLWRQDCVESDQRTALLKAPISSRGRQTTD